ncbi:MAG: hypothetical protein AB7F43_01515 [Bacteriovoracia bacterium]
MLVYIIIGALVGGIAGFVASTSKSKEKTNVECRYEDKSKCND